MQTYIILAGFVALGLSIVFGLREVVRARARAPRQPVPPPPESPVLVPAANEVGESEEEITKYASIGTAIPEDLDIEPQFSETKALAFVEEGPVTDSATGPTRFFIAHAVAQSDVGRRRRRNEDAYAVLASHGLYVVADGMGGYAGGDLASTLAVQTIIGHYERNEVPALRKPDPNLPPRAIQLVGSIENANHAIFERALQDEKLHGMGTTVVAAHFLERNQRVVIAHVGDSRCYRLRGGMLKQLTRDHTLAEKGVEGPMGKHIRRAVGIKKKIYVDVVYDTPQFGDRYLLCSDGLTKMVDDTQILSTLGTMKKREEAAKTLVDRSNAAGGADNITVVIIDVMDVDTMRSSLPNNREFGGAAIT